MLLARLWTPTFQADHKLHFKNAGLVLGLVQQLFNLVVAGSEHSNGKAVDDPSDTDREDKAMVIRCEPIAPVDHISILSESNENRSDMLIEGLLPHMAGFWRVKDRV